jgi:ribonuclease R
MSLPNPDHLKAFFRDHPERPWHVQDVQKHFGLDERTDLKRALDELVGAGDLIRTRRRTYGLPTEMNLVPGRLQVTSGGYGFVIREGAEGRDLFVPADKLAGAWDGDKVLARPSTQDGQDDARPSATIVRILERKNALVVGTLEYAKGYAILRPDGPKFPGRILLEPESVGRLDAGLRIVVKIVWPEDSGEREPFGQVADVLGEQDDPQVETRAVIVKYGLKDAYDPGTLAEASAVPSSVDGEMLAGRTDHRGVATFTIDGADAKDFDDALSVERLGEGKRGANAMLRVGVHIADVSYYVAEGTHLDAEARERATSCYLPGKVLPMLPESLSNGICSLVEGEPRLALSVFVDIGRDGTVHAVRFKETVISSDARLTYDQVQAFAEGDRLPAGKRKLERDVKVLLNLAQTLREQRLGAGALDFDFTEAKVDVDDEGALHLQPIRSNAARQLVEEMMLLANRLVAQELRKRDLPALFRVHEDPSEAKIDTLQKALTRLGYTFDVERATTKDLQNVLRQAAGRPEAQLVHTLLLRSLKQARYAAENLGHFGLAFENYLHFTSPIRRYPDLVVHRVVRAMLQHRLSPTLKERLKSDFPGLAQHASERERTAEQAERDLARYFHARWARDHVGERFHGTISGVTNFGIFVSLQNGIEGLLHVSHLDDDYYVFLEDAMMMLGKSTRKRFRMGDRIEVRIHQANPTARQIDFVLPHADVADVPAAEPPKRSRAPKHVKEPFSEPVQAVAEAPEVSTGDDDGARSSSASRRGRRGRGKRSGAATDERAKDVAVQARPQVDAGAANDAVEDAALVSEGSTAPVSTTTKSPRRRRRLVFASPYRDR